MHGSSVLCLILLPFSMSELLYSILEETDIGSSIGDLIADAQLRSRYSNEVASSLRFTFLMPPAIPLIIDETTGKITTSGRIDRENVCRTVTLDMETPCRVRLDVAVRPVQYFQMIKIVIEIRDINDNNPEFIPSAVIREIMESSLPGTGFVIPTARDADTTTFGVRRYEITAPEDSAMFGLNISQKLDGSTEVRLVLRSTLDRETAAEHNVRVTAFDADENQPRSGDLEITVIVLDSNDNHPSFEYSAYEVSVVENIPVGTIVAHVIARDPDIGLNGQVVYSFSASTQAAYGDVFAVDDITGDVIVVGTVDYERTTVYHLIVTARDRGMDPVPVEATVVIKVDDVNDNAPLITINTLTAPGTDVANVLEDVNIGTFVGHVLVHDPDRGASGRFNCSLESGQWVQIVTRKNYSRVVSVVSDENDNIINEKDTSQHGMPFRLQQVFHSEYHLVTSALLDREKRSKYLLAVVCMDGGSSSLTSVKQLTIDVLDVNDNIPVFDKKLYSAELYENNYSGATILQVNASDDDFGDNARLRYELIPSSGSHEFTIDRSLGTIMAANSLDRERQSQYRFQIKVCDHGLPAMTSYSDVIVRVLDVNDEPPRFSSTFYRFEVAENQPAGEHVGSVTATDSDHAPFNKFTFCLLVSELDIDTGAFKIEPETGKIITNRYLDREQQDEHKLIVKVTDFFKQEMSSTTIVTIFIRDVNDNIPVFVFPSVLDATIKLLTWQVLAGQTIGRIDAVDDDIGSNAEIIYSLDSDAGTNSDLFSVDPETGVLSANVNLQPSVNDNSSIYSLIVTASNPSSPQGHSEHTTRSMLRVVVDKPVSPLFGQRGRHAFVFTGKSIAAIVSVGVVSAVVIIVLLVAIAIVLCRQRRRTKDFVTSTRYEIAPINGANDNVLHNKLSGTKPTVLVRCTGSAMAGNTTDQITTNPTCSYDNTLRDVTAKPIWKPSVMSCDIDVLCSRSSDYSSAESVNSNTLRQDDNSFTGKQHPASSSDRSTIHVNNSTTRHDNVIYRFRCSSKKQSVITPTCKSGITNRQGPGTSSAAACGGTLYQLPPPAYHSVTSFKPSSYTQNGSFIGADTSHLLVDGQIMRSISATQTPVTSIVYDSELSTRHDIQVRRLQSNICQ